MTYEQKITAALAQGAAILGDVAAARQGGKVAVTAAYAKRRANDAMAQMGALLGEDPQRVQLAKEVRVWGRIAHRLIMGL